ncbi:MAG TPA: Fe-S cluster assembly ATPase SufC [Firmicutes bacterium]|nr:Fe-S cluster assembly ATPase SufC [Bacillota bacterium]HAV19742.1 Fe-S cluster assembly ATPase SufC [Bacillota bacterium]
MAKLIIKDLWVQVEGQDILKGVDLTLSDHETLALLGPNGHGKSTLLGTIMGHPKYIVTEGSMTLDGTNLLTMAPDERARAGLFLGMQNPSEVPGVVNSDFLKAAMNTRRVQPLAMFEFYRALDKATKVMKIPLELAHRPLNEGFSGGEKKRNEILQLLLLEPSIALLDEIDSGLDIDALSMVGHAIATLQQKGVGFLVISHYARLYDLVTPNRVAVMIDGKIVVTGGQEIIQKIDRTGYDWIRAEYGISIEKVTPTMNTTSLGVCATKEKTRL